MRPFTDIERANNNFYGNYVDIDMQLDELIVFLGEVNGFIKDTTTRLESQIQEADSDRLENLQYHFKYTQGEILHTSIIISIVILLEAEIDTYCQSFKDHKKLAISYRDFKGDFLEKFKTFSIKVLESSFSFQESLWQDIIGIYEIRNSLIHNSGLLTDFGKRKIVENFIQRNKSFAVDEYERIIISHQSCLDCILIIQSFFKQITEFAFIVFPDRYSDTSNNEDELF